MRSVYVRTLSNIIWDTLKNFKQFHLANCALHNERHLLPKTSDSGRKPASQSARPTYVNNALHQNLKYMRLVCCVCFALMVRARSFYIISRTNIHYTLFGIPFV